MMMMMMTEQRCKNGGTDQHAVWDGTDRGRDRFVGLVGVEFNAPLDTI